MNIISIEQLRKYASGESYLIPYYEKLEDGIRTLLESGVLKNVLDKEHFFYPKYLWLKDKDIELFFITEDKLIKCTLAEIRMINIKTKFLKDVSQLDIRKLNIDQHEIELKVTFTDGEIFTFTSNDSNMSWKYKFYLEILELYSRLS